MYSFSTVIVEILAFAVVASAYTLNNKALKREWDHKCGNSTFCTKKFHNYPTELIEKLLKDLEPIEDNSEVGPEHRVGDVTQPCIPLKNSNPIYEIIDEEGNVRHVVQSEQKFKQLVNLEDCQTKVPTNEKEVLIMSSNNFTCGTKKIDYRFMVLSLDHKSLEWVYVNEGLPVCCYIKYHI